MIGATHFIEQYRLAGENTKSSHPAPMRLLDWYLLVSRNHGYKTIAIFKIKFK